MPTHYMQSSTWAEIKSGSGWKTRNLELKSLNKNCVIYSRMVPALGTLHYIPGLSDLTPENAKPFTTELKKELSKGFGVRAELYQPYDETLLTSLEKSGWKKIKRHVQYRDTILIDLTKSEDEILASFKSRARYEIKQALGFGVSAKEAELTPENLDKMYDLLQETSVRNKFYIRDKNFTLSFWNKFAETGKLKLFFATHEKKVVAGAVTVINEDYAWYKEGGSLRAKSNLMAPRLLLWEVMKTLKVSGVKVFDLGGIPSPDNHQNSSMHGIYVFKSAFSRETVTLMPAMELPLNSKYKLWNKAEEQWLRVYNLVAKKLWW